MRKWEEIEERESFIDKKNSLLISGKLFERICAIIGRELVSIR